MEKLIALLFLSRDLAHRAHLKTTSHAQHVALGDFYSEVIGLADSLAEAYQGRHGLLKDIPLLGAKQSADITKTLRAHLKEVEGMRYSACDKEYSPIQNIIDEICGLYLTTLYKLENLK